MKVSVITPFYQGNRYMDRYVSAMKQNAKNLQSEDELEVLLVNDSPWEKVVLPGESGQEGWIHVIENRENIGIHGSRVHGLSQATGEYLLFLDQDDELAPDALRKMIGKAKQNPGSVIVCNALLEQANGRELWYRTDYHKQRIGDLGTYLKVGIQIISPGQCLVSKDVIPDLWKRRICTKNGADDYYLWLLLLKQKIRFSLLDEPLYVHRYTAKNLSSDTRVTDASSYEFLSYMEEESAMSSKEIALLRRMLRYKDAFRRGSAGTKISESLKNPDLFAANVIFKLRSGTRYGFNRENTTK